MTATARHGKYLMLWLGRYFFCWAGRGRKGSRTRFVNLGGSLKGQPFSMRACVRACVRAWDMKSSHHPRQCDDWKTNEVREGVRE